MRENQEKMLIHEVALLFGNSTGAIRDWVRAGILKCERASNGYRIFNREDVYKLYEEGKVNEEGRGNA